MTPLEIVTLAITLIGVFFVVVSSVGLVRLPDLYTRVHAGANRARWASSGCCWAGVFFITDLRIVTKMLILIAFFFITGPVAAHMLDRAALLSGVKPMEGTHPNDLEGVTTPRRAG